MRTSSARVDAPNAELPVAAPAGNSDGRTFANGTGEIDTVRSRRIGAARCCATCVAGEEFVLSEGDANAAAPDQIWRQKPKPVNVGDRPQGEGVSYGRDGLTLYASSEKRNAPLFMIRRK